MGGMFGHGRGGNQGKTASGKWPRENDCGGWSGSGALLLIEGRGDVGLFEAIHFLDLGVDLVEAVFGVIGAFVLIAATAILSSFAQKEEDFYD